MLGAFALALTLSAHPVEEPADPPLETVDFFGRRRLCAQLPPARERRPSDEREARRLACDRLAAEARELGARHANDAAFRAWLVRDPLSFRLGGIQVSAWHGPPPANVRRIEQTGTDARSGDRYRLVVDRDAEGGRATRITVSFGSLPERGFEVENERFPQLDLATARVALGSGPPGERLVVRLRFGHLRGYCADLEEDDRPELSVAFGRDGIEAVYQDRLNCRGDYFSLTPR